MHPFSNVVVRHGRGNLTGKVGSVDGAVRDLDQISLLEACDIASRLSAVLSDEHSDSTRAQIRLIRSLLPSSASGILRRLERAELRERMREPPKPRHVVFEELPVLNAIKVALLANLRLEGVHEHAPEHFARAVLNISDVVDSGPPTPKNATDDTRENLEKWAYYAFVTMIARHEEDGAHAMARAAEITFRIPATLTGSDNFVDLASAVLRRTGLTVAEFWTWLFAVQAHYRSITADNVATATSIVDLARFFSGAALKFTLAESEAMCTLFARTPEAFRLRMNGLFTNDNLAPFDLSPFYETPFVRFDSKIVAPSVRLLIGKLSFGLHHTVQFMLPREDRHRYFRLAGESYELYVMGMMKRIAIAQRSTHLGEHDLRRTLPVSAAEGQKLADGVLFDDDSILIWDAKAWWPNDKVLGGRSKRDFVAWLRSLVRRAGRQCANTVRLQRAGAFAAAGLDDRRRRVLPAVVSYMPFPMAPHIERLIRALVSEEVPAETLGSTELAILTARELEWLEPHLNDTQSLQRLLSDRQDDRSAEGLSLHNYCLARRIHGYGVIKNPHLESSYSDLMADLDHVVESRGQRDRTSVLHRRPE